ncbi:MAG: redoxin domain-containing protein [Proteobacteria bacterium]|nr:redoxin domain-containing protein [Pseudomonadota bacterium]
MTLLQISNTALWLVIIVLAAVVLALVRQLGVLHERIAPASALVRRSGLVVGDPAPPVEVADLDGRAHPLGSARSDGRSTLLLFVSATCPVCKTLLPVARSRSGEVAQRMEVILAGEGNAAAQRQFVREHQLEGIPFVAAPGLALAYQVGRLPFAAVIDSQGILRAQGLVESAQQFEKLLGPSA